MIAQILVDGLIAGAMIGLGAIGITLTYSILRFANFAHGEFIAWGAYVALAVGGALGHALRGTRGAHWALLLRLVASTAAFVASMVLTGLLALARRCAAVRPAARPAGAVIILVMASFGAALTLRSLLEFLFTSKPAYFTAALQIAMKIGRGVRATPDQLLSLGVAPCSCLRSTFSSPAPQSAAPCAR